jgi:ADP-ribosyltransferase exoenzyme
MDGSEPADGSTGIDSGTGGDDVGLTPGDGGRPSGAASPAASVVITGRVGGLGGRLRDLSGLLGGLGGRLQRLVPRSRRRQVVAASLVVVLVAGAAWVLRRDSGVGSPRTAFETALTDLAAAPALRYTTSGFGGEVVVPYEVTATGEARAHVDDVAALPGDISSELLFVDNQLFVRMTGSLDLGDLGLDTSNPVVEEALENAQNQEGSLGSGDWVTSVSEYDGPILRDTMSPVGLAIKLTDLLVQTPDDQLREANEPVDGTPALVAETSGGEIYISSTPPHRVLRFVPARPPGAENDPPPALPTLPSIPDMPDLPQRPGMPTLPSIPDLPEIPGMPDAPGGSGLPVAPPQAEPEPAPGDQPPTAAEATDAAVPMLEQAVDHIDLEVLDGDEVQQVYDAIADSTAELDGAVDGILQFAEGEMAESLQAALRSGDALGDCGAGSCEVEADATLVHGRGNEVPTRLTFAMTVDGQPAGECTARGVIPVSGTGPLGCTNDSEEWTATYRSGADVAVEVVEIEAMALTPEDVETVTADIEAHADAAAAMAGGSAGAEGFQFAGASGPRIQGFAGAADVGRTGADPAGGAASRIPGEDGAGDPLVQVLRELDIRPSRWGEFAGRIGDDAGRRLPTSERITAVDVEVLRQVLLEGAQPWRGDGALLDRIDPQSAKRVVERALRAQTRSELQHAIDTLRTAFRIIRTSALAPGRQDSLASGARILLDVGEPTARSGDHFVNLLDFTLAGSQPPEPLTFEEDDLIGRDEWGFDVHGGQQYGREVWADAHAQIIRGAPAEGDALRSWIGAGYRQFQTYLLSSTQEERERHLMPGQIAEIAEHVRHIDNAVNRQPVPQPLVAVRRTRLRELGVDRGEDLRPGELVTQRNYMATALRGRPSHGDGDVELYLEVPAGTPGIFLEAPWMFNPQTGFGPREAELLLARGLTWEIVGQPRLVNGKWVVRGRILPMEGPAGGGSSGRSQSSPDGTEERANTRTIDVLYPAGDGTWIAGAVVHDATQTRTAQFAEQLQVLRGLVAQGGRGVVIVAQDGNLDQLFTPVGTAPSAASDASRAPVGEARARADAPAADERAADRHNESARVLSASGYAAEPGGDTGVAVRPLPAAGQAPGATGLLVEGMPFAPRAPAPSTSMRDFIESELTDGQSHYVVNLNDQPDPEQALQDLLGELAEAPVPGLEEVIVVVGEQPYSVVPYQGTPLEQIAGQPPSTTGSPDDASSGGTGTGGSGGTGTGTGGGASTPTGQRVRVRVPVPAVPPAPAPTTPSSPTAPAPTNPTAPAPTSPTAPTTRVPTPAGPPTSAPTGRPAPPPTGRPAPPPAGWPPLPPTAGRPSPPLGASIGGGRVELTPGQVSDVSAQGRQMANPQTGGLSDADRARIRNSLGMRNEMTNRGVRMHPTGCTCPPCRPTTAS